MFTLEAFGKKIKALRRDRGSITGIALFSQIPDQITAEHPPIGHPAIGLIITAPPGQAVDKNVLHRMPF